MAVVVVKDTDEGVCVVVAGGGGDSGGGWQSHLDDSLQHELALPLLLEAGGRAGKAGRRGEHGSGFQQPRATASPPAALPCAHLPGLFQPSLQRLAGDAGGLLRTRHQKRLFRLPRLVE